MTFPGNVAIIPRPDLIVAEPERTEACNISLVCNTQRVEVAGRGCYELTRK